MSIAQHSRQAPNLGLEPSVGSPVDSVGGMPDARLHISQSGLAKSPCRGFATRNLTGAGSPPPVFF